MKRILCFGDSNTYGHSAELYEARDNNKTRFDENTRYPKVLEQLFHGEYEVIEEGCGGRMSAFGEGDNAWLNGLKYVYPCVESHAPLSAVVLMLGTNDINNMGGQDAKHSAEGVRKIVNEIRRWSSVQGKTCPHILVVSPPLIKVADYELLKNVYDYEWAEQESRKFKQYFEIMAKEENCAFLASEDYAEASSIDGVHLSAESHRCLGKAIFEKLSKML